MTLTLTSSAFRHGARIPREHTCEGADTSPPLAWSGAPAATRSFALICADPDAPVGTWYHWGIFDLPATASGLPAGYPKQARALAGGVPARQAITDFRRPGYGGPCPPRGHGTHHYHFRLLALDVATLPLAESADCRALEAAAAGHILAEAVLTGLFDR